MPQRLTQLDIDRIRARKPARRLVEIPEKVKQALSEGVVPTMNLTEWLASDRQTLLSSVLTPIDLDVELESKSLWTPELLSQSALKQSFEIGKWLSARFKIGDEVWRRLSTHPSDVVREWSAIMIGLSNDITFARKLAWIKPFADDENSGLREIAWLSLRGEVIRDPDRAIQFLVPWTGSRNERLRRYASEITRPCGVWTSHVLRLKEQPELGLPILEPLLADDSKYVRNSVGNWLNDASKSQPEWVQSITTRWLAESNSVHTQYIVKRALRTINKR